MSDAPPSESRPLTGGAVMSGVSRGTVAVTGAATTILVARLLGAPGAGAYAIAQALLLMLMVGTTLGVEHGIAYYVSSGRWSPRRANSAGQRVAVLSGITGAGLATAARLLFPSAFGGLPVATTVVVACALPFSLSWLYFTYVALATDRYEAFVLPPAIQSTLALALVAVLGAVYGLSGAIVGFAVAHLATAVGTWILGRRSFRASGEPESADANGELRRAIAFGIKGYAANALQLVNYRLDLFLLAAVAGASAVGHYAVAVSVTGVLWLLPQALSDVVFPRVSALTARRDEVSEASREFVETKSMRHTAAVVAGAAIVLAAALTLLVVPIYGAAFRPAIALGLILLPGVALLGLTNTMGATIVGRGHPGYMFATTALITPLTIVLYVVLIPALHATGAALASSISYTCSFVLVAICYRRLTGRPLLPRLMPSRSELADYRMLLSRVSAR